MASYEQCSLDTQVFRNVRAQFLASEIVERRVNHDNESPRKNGTDANTECREAERREGGGRDGPAARAASAPHASRASIASQLDHTHHPPNLERVSSIFPPHNRGCVAENEGWRFNLKRQLKPKDRNTVLYTPPKCQSSNTSTARPNPTHPTHSHLASAHSSACFETILESHKPPMEDAPVSTETGDTQVATTQEFELLISKARAAADLNISRRSKDPSPEVEETYESGPSTHRIQDADQISLASSPASKADHEASSGARSLEYDNENSQDELGTNLDGDENDTVTSPAPTSPVTPAVTGQKRDREGNVVASSTPAGENKLAAMFKAPASKHGVGLSQVFKQTQAATSPIADALTPDPFVDRPWSESQFHPARYSPSSSTPLPTRNFATPGTREPKATYISKRDSQKKREIFREVRSDPVGEEDELGEDSGARRAQNRIWKRERDARSNQEFGALVASSAADQLKPRPKTAESHSAIETPAFIKGKQVIDLCDTTPAEPLRLEDGDSDVTDMEDSDEPDELGQEVVSGKGLKDKETKQRLSAQNDVGGPRSSPVPFNSQRATDMRATHSFHAGQNYELNPKYISPNNASQHVWPSQSVKVMDSQEDKTGHEDQPKYFRPEDLVLESSSGRRARQANAINQASSTEHPVPESPPSSPPHITPRDSDMLLETRGADHRGYDLEDIPAEIDTQPEQQTDLHERSHGQIDQKTDRPTVINRQQGKTPVKQATRDSIPETSPALAAKSQNSSHNIETDLNLVPSQPSTAEDTVITSKQVADNKALLESHSNDAFETAPTHLYARTGDDVENSEAHHLTAKSSHLRHFRSFVNSQGESSELGPVTINLDVLNEVDKDYETAISVPVDSEFNSKGKQKKSRSRRITLQEPAPEANILPNPKVSPANRSRNQNAGPAQLIPNKGEPLVKGKLKKPKANAMRNLQNGGMPFKALHTESEFDLELVSEKGAQEIHQLGMAAAASDHNHVTEKSSSRVESRIPTVRPQEHHPSGNLQQEPTTHASKRGDSVTKRKFPTKVWARFKDHRFYYYPATALCKNNSGSQTSYTIKFYDGNVDNDLSASFVRSLELQRGDIIKIDRPDFPKTDYVVQELRCVVEDTANEECVTDVFGHQTLLVTPKQRQSGSVAGPVTDTEAREVPIADIYVTNKLWGKYTDRVLKDDWFLALHDGIHTPDGGDSRPGTPTSRNRRQVFAPAQKPSFHVQTSALESTAGIFSNMIFAVTYSQSKDKEKELVLKTITENGGQILSGSFEDLFEKSSWLPSHGREVGLKLLDNRMNAGFVALIADGHSRRIKFMQALALNIPCLSGRWVVDSVSRKTLLPWMHYLLPAGNSDLLDGALRSRTFPESSKVPEGAGHAKLSAIIEARQKFLYNKNVIVVVEKRKGNQIEARAARERHEQQVFVSCVLGAPKIARVEGPLTAARLAKEEPDSWDWLLVEKGMYDDATEALRKASLPSKRRKIAIMDGHGDMPLQVVSDEWLYQSLIAGVLIDEIGLN